MGNEQTYRTAKRVFRAGENLQASLGDPAQVTLAVNQLALAAEQSIMQLDELGQMGFESTDRVTTPQQRSNDVDTVLAKALSQLNEANTLLAASRAIGELEAAEPNALERPLQGFATTLPLLNKTDVPDTQRFAAEPTVRSATTQEAIAACDKQVTATLNAVTKRSTDVIVASVTGMRDGGPEFLQKIWKSVNDTLHLDKIGGKLAKLGLRLFSSALDLLSRLMPSARLAAIREELDTLIGKLDQGSPTEAIVGSVLGVNAARPAATEAFKRSGLDMKQLDGGTAALAMLAVRHDKQLELWDAVSSAIGYARLAAAFLKIVIPNLGMITLGANMVVVGAVVVIGRDYVAGDGPDGNNGVRMIVDNATS
jgi:hypothetical protein